MPKKGDEALLDEQQGHLDDTSLETGVKVIDLFCPILRGGTFEWIGPVGCGQIVLLAEVIGRWVSRYHIAPIILGVAGRDPRAHLTDALVGPDAPGLLDTRTWTAFPKAEDPDAWPEELARARRRCSELVVAGRDVLIILDRAWLGSSVRNISDVLASAGRTEKGSVTVGIFAPHRPGEPPFGPNADFSTSVVFDASLAKRGWYPSVSPLASVGPERPVSAELVRETRYRLKVAKIVEAYLTQSLYATAAAFGRDGTWVRPEVTSRDLRSILDREIDPSHLSHLLHGGSIAEINGH